MRKSVYLSYEVREVAALVEVLAVAVDVLAEEGDVLIPGLDEAARLCHDVVKAPGALPAPDVGDDAVGAEVVAAVHDGEPGLDAALPVHGQALRDDALAGRDLKDPASPPRRALVELGEAPELVRAEAEVHYAEGVFYLLGHVRLLDHAAADRDDEPRVARLGVDERADVAQDAHLRVPAHGAGVHDDELGLVLVLGEAEAHELYIAAQGLAVGLVLLAAVGVHKGQGPRAAQALAYFCAYLPLPLQLCGGDLNSLVSHISSETVSIVRIYFII